MQLTCISLGFWNHGGFHQEVTSRLLSVCVCVCVRVWIRAAVYVCLFSHQQIDGSQCVIGSQQRRGQLVHPIVRLAVAIETNAYGNTA